jgi:hypothetical protein
VTVRLSNRGYNLLAMFRSGVYMSLAEARKWDQRAFRSMLVNEYVAHHPGRGFRITPKGLEVRASFDETDVRRKPNRWSFPLTRYFDPTAYQLGPDHKGAA